MVGGKSKFAQINRG